MRSPTYIRLSVEEAQEIFMLLGVWIMARNAMAAGFNLQLPQKQIERLVSKEVESASAVIKFVTNAADELRRHEAHRESR